MNKAYQQAFIANVQAALGNPGRLQQRRDAIFAAVDPTGRQALLDRIGQRSTEQQMQLLDRLTRQAAPLNLPVVPVSGAAAATAAICRLVREKKPEWGDSKSVAVWQHALIGELNLTDALTADHVPVHLSKTDTQHTDAARAEMRARVVESFVGITAADYCLAETATLVLTSGPGRPRSISLVPSIHVAVIALNQIIANLTELYALLKQGTNGKPGNMTHCLTFITGPSKTADIELNMVHGAHGPRELHLFVLTP